jgi:hypothetical protein
VEPSAILPQQPSERDALQLEEGLPPEPKATSPAYADPPCLYIPSTYPPASTLMELTLNSSLDIEPLAPGPAPTRPVCPSPTAADTSEGSSPPSHTDAYNPTARILPYNGSLDKISTPPCQPLDSNTPTTDHPSGSRDTPDLLQDNFQSYTSSTPPDLILDSEDESSKEAVGGLLSPRWLVPSPIELVSSRARPSQPLKA